MLIISFDNTLKNNLGLMVSCRKFRQVAIFWMLLLVDCESCWIGVVLVPFGQKGFRPFLACVHQLPYSRASSILNYIWRLVFKYFWVLCLKNWVFKKCPKLMFFVEVWLVCFKNCE